MTTQATPRVPTTVRVEGQDIPVFTAVYLPPAPATLAAHIVAYQRTPRPDGYATGVLVHDHDEDVQDRLTEGAYDLTLTEAMVDVSSRYVKITRRLVEQLTTTSGRVIR